MAMAVMVALSCVLFGTAVASAAPAGVRPMPVTTRASAWYVPSAPPIAAVPGCGKGANVRKVVATYKAKKYEAGGYRTDTLYCGNSDCWSAMPGRDRVRCCEEFRGTHGIRAERANRVAEDLALNR